MCSTIVSLNINKFLLRFTFLINQGYRMTPLSNPNCCKSPMYNKWSLLEKKKKPEMWRLKQRSTRVLHQTLVYKKRRFIKDRSAAVTRLRQQRRSMRCGIDLAMGKPRRQSRRQSSKSGCTEFRQFAPTQTVHPKRALNKKEVKPLK